MATSIKTSPTAATARQALTWSASGRNAEHSGLLRGKRWPLAVIATLSILGVVIAAAFAGFAVILPLLYIVPCILMLALCMRGKGSDPTSDSST